MRDPGADRLVQHRLEPHVRRHREEEPNAADLYVAEVEELYGVDLLLQRLLAFATLGAWAGRASRRRTRLARAHQR
jgi:hypothetical protein